MAKDKKYPVNSIEVFQEYHQWWYNDKGVYAKYAFETNNHGCLNGEQLTGDN